MPPGQGGKVSTKYNKHRKTNRIHDNPSKNLREAILHHPPAIRAQKGTGGEENGGDISYFVGTVYDHTVGLTSWSPFTDSTI